MNLKTLALVVSAPVWLPLLFVVLLLGALVAAFVPLSDEACVEFGIVPSRHRYDQDFIEGVRARSMGGAR